MRPAASEALDGLHQIIREFVAQSERQEEPVVHYANEKQLRGKLDLSLPEKGEGEEALGTWAQGYLDNAVRTGSWRYFNQLWSGFSLPGFYGEVIAALSNTSMFTYEVAPVATLIEKELIQRLGELVGYDHCDGLFVTGGSNANMMAMMAARFSLQADCRDEGIDGRRLQLFVSDQAHYSFAKAANLMGIGVNNVVKVASDEQARMKPAALLQAICDSRAAGNTPFFVGGTAGTTVIGAFDPLEALAEICQSEGLWFHIDGAFGGSALLSDQLRDKLKGCELSDSFTWDQHKMMGMPLICSTVLLRQRGLLRAMNNVGGEDYIFHDSEEEQDLGPKSVQCGRRVDALKLWMAWKCFGRRGFAERIENLFYLSQRFAKQLEQHPRFEMGAPVASVSLCFRFVPAEPCSESEIDRLNLLARDCLAKSGAALVNYAQLDGRPFWRLVLTNFDLDEAAMDRLFELIEAACVEAFDKGRAEVRDAS